MTKFPMLLKANSDTKDAILEAKETLRSVPHFGYGYRYLADMQKLKPVQANKGFGFEYFDQNMDSSSQRGHLVEVKSFHPDGDIIYTDYKLNLSCTHKDNEIKCIITFNSKFCSEKEIEKIPALLQQHFEKVGTFCLKSDKQFTPSDFPDADLSGDDLDELLKQL
jgi:non-ribosomal peptide synthase protein (TIGR01720 family)